MTAYALAHGPAAVSTFAGGAAAAAEDSWITGVDESYLARFSCILSLSYDLDRFKEWLNKIDLDPTKHYTNHPMFGRIHIS